jgi:hypothetical protein
VCAYREKLALQVSREVLEMMDKLEIQYVRVVIV